MLRVGKKPLYYTLLPKFWKWLSHFQNHISLRCLWNFMVMLDNKCFFLISEN